MDPLDIKSSRGVYTVHFRDDLANLSGELAGLGDVLVVIDEKVAGLYSGKLSALLPKAVLVRATEENKTLAGCEQILRGLVARGAGRGTRVLAIGGGIIQDLTTLSAHLYHRGISWLYVPTTLLAMADSCIGAKASINFEGYKNQLGAFHGPDAVFICTEFLATLPVDEIRSGYGEVFKLHFASSTERFFKLAAAVSRDGWLTPAIGATIRDCLEIKKRYIEADEFDAGIRRHLNYGHTFGHALESVTGHAIPHGLAVCWGMDLINFLAADSGRMGQPLFRRAHEVYSSLFSFRMGAPIGFEPLLEATKRDKKAAGGRMNLVMPGPNGELGIVKEEYTPELSMRIRLYLTSFNIVTSLSPAT
jgi:3-dehydroquinate synthase